MSVLRQLSINSAKDLLTAASDPSDSEMLKIALRSLAKDITNLTSLLGVGRNAAGGFVVQDFLDTQGRFPNLMEVDEHGVLRLGNNYGERPNLFGVVKGSFYAVPQWAKFYSSTTQAAGTIVFDGISFNNSGDLYFQTTGNTRIQIKVPGDYQYIATVQVDLGTLLAGAGAQLSVTFNGTAIKYSTITFQTIASNVDLFTMVITGYVQTNVFSDYLTVVLAGVGGGAPESVGSADPHTTFEICKVN